jgi:hypothetical protein
MTREEKIQYVAASILGSCLSEAEAREINGSVGWHPDDVEGEAIFRLSEDDLALAIERANREKEQGR